MSIITVPKAQRGGQPVADEPSNGVRSDPGSREVAQPVGAVLRQWVLERGVLYALTQTPILAIIAGTPFMSVVPYTFAVLPMFAAFVMLPMWIAYRKKVSTNPDEPVHHLHKYALWALAPAAMFTVVRIPLFYLMGIIYWHPWYDFGNALTGAGIVGQHTLATGGLMNAIQGWAMGLGFYILFKKHSLINVLLYICVWISGLYSFTFGTYSRVGMGSPPYWHAAMAWAHFGMAITLWFTPLFYRRVWPGLRMAGRLATVAVGALILLTPSLFAQYQAIVWEFPYQDSIDKATLDRPNLVSLKGAPVLTQVGPEAQYQFTLTFGPRSYRNWFKQTRALDAGPVDVQGRLRRDGEIIAWCAAKIDRLPTPNKIILPVQFPAAMKSMEYTDIPVSCVGPAALARSVSEGAPITVEWSAQMTLHAYRTQVVKTFTGNQPISLLLKAAPKG
jgi:hypothetical protein